MDTQINRIPSVPAEQDEYDHKEDDGGYRNQNIRDSQNDKQRRDEQNSRSRACSDV